MKKIGIFMADGFDDILDFSQMQLEKAEIIEEK